MTKVSVMPNKYRNYAFYRSDARRVAESIYSQCKEWPSQFLTNLPVLLFIINIVHMVHKKLILKMIKSLEKQKKSKQYKQ